MEPRAKPDPQSTRPPHPATVAQKRPMLPDGGVRPPHPATVMQKRASLGGVAERPPHPATVAQKRPFVGVTAARPPHAAAVNAGSGRRTGAAQPSFLIFKPESYPVSVKDFETGTVVISQSQIREAVIAALQSGKAAQIGSTGYSVTARDGYVHIYFGDDAVGFVRFTIKGKVAGVQTINVANTYQGMNHSRVLITAFAIACQQLKCVQYTLATEDTSKGWWSQWGTTIFKSLLQRPDLGTIYVPANPNDQANPQKLDRARRIREAKIELFSLARAYGWSNSEFERQAKIKAGLLADVSVSGDQPLHDYSSEYIS